MTNTVLTANATHGGGDGSFGTTDGSNGEGAAIYSTRTSACSNPTPPADPSLSLAKDTIDDNVATGGLGDGSSGSFGGEGDGGGVLIDVGTHAIISATGFLGNSAIGAAGIGPQGDGVGDGGKPAGGGLAVGGVAILNQVTIVANTSNGGGAEPAAMVARPTAVASI